MSCEGDIFPHNSKNPPCMAVSSILTKPSPPLGPAEAHKAEKAMKVLGGEIRQLTPVTLPGVAEDRYIVVAKKIAATPKGYPRKPGIPAKKPL